jgi:thiol-disulfide isomerase/thioredoxin
MMKRICALLVLAVLLTGCAGEGGGYTEDFTLPPATQSMSATFPGLGGVMPEMTVTTTEGEELTLSELLEEKKLVVLNFWFADCVWCRKEFPVMELAYQRYQEDVEIIALNPVDPEYAIEVFQKSGSLSFPMASCPRSWVVEMGVTGYPTSVFIDRDGVVCLIHAGAITNSDDFYKIFETFTADDYQRKIYRSIDELVR